MYSKFDKNVKNTILKSSIGVSPWPICAYKSSGFSKRSGRTFVPDNSAAAPNDETSENSTASITAEGEKYYDRKRDISLERYLEPLEMLSQYRIICCDGMSGTTKSTIANSSNRAYSKINIDLPEITTGSLYNLQPVQAIRYILAQIDTLRVNKRSSVIFDRDPFSNLRFYCVHHLMSIYGRQKQLIPVHKRDEVYDHLNKLATGCNLLGTLKNFYWYCLERPSFIMVCSDIPLLSIIMSNRPNKDVRCQEHEIVGKFYTNDELNSCDHNYQVAQYHVYKYFAEMLCQPVVDIAYMADAFQMNIYEIQYEILKRINYKYSSFLQSYLCINYNKLTDVLDCQWKRNRYAKEGQTCGNMLKCSNILRSKLSDKILTKMIDLETVNSDNEECDEIESDGDFIPYKEILKTPSNLIELNDPEGTRNDNYLQTWCDDCADSFVFQESLK